jgi:hypothetical protein
MTTSSLECIFAQTSGNDSVSFLLPFMTSSKFVLVSISASMVGARLIGRAFERYVSSLKLQSKN